jgi:short-subunit dehydrogenase
MSAKQSVLITGASDGIGKALARAFARRGHPVALIARRKELLEQLAAECKSLGAPRAELAAVDVTDSRLFRDALGAFDERFGGLDIYVANAGIDAPYRAEEDGMEAIRRVIAVNVLAAMDGIEFLKTRMLARGRGTLVGITSVASARGLPGAGPYCASKAAFHAYLEGLNFDLSKTGVRVLTVAPGFVATAMTAKNKFTMPFLMKVERAGEVFATAILRGRRLAVAPWQFVPVFWFLKALPDSICRRLPLSR